MGYWISMTYDGSSRRMGASCAVRRQWFRKRAVLDRARQRFPRAVHVVILFAEHGANVLE